MEPLVTKLIGKRAALKERKLPRSKRGYQKILLITFWFLFISTFWFMFQAYQRTAYVNNKLNILNNNIQEKTKDSTTNSLISQDATVSFAEHFAQIYLKVEPDQNARMEREQQLVKMLASNLAVQELEGTADINANRTVTSINPYKVKVLNKSQAFITLLVSYNIEKPNVEPQEITQLLNLTIGTDGTNFNVIEQPYLLPAPAEAKLEKVENSMESKPELTNVEVKRQANDFLKQFFTSYGKATLEEMKYLMNSPESLNGFADFTGLEKTKIYEAQAKGHYVVKTIAVFKDKATHADMRYSFTLYISKKDGKFYVNKLTHTLN
ncbi:conjugal transfer protein [Ectobacillus funiculus]|uniref:conjugal transfer protein n=1 Tax=Ectobacillus funiculus TaxID=137993 RepID=UPI0036D37CB4